jgi:cbb3-type cytochrome oxidase cytochrome c subunit
MIPRGALLAACVWVLLVMSACRGVPDGSVIFEREGCTLCHRFKDMGSGLDLTEVTSRRSDAWIREQIRSPRRHRPDTGMRSFAHLSRAEIDALVRLLHTGDK